MCFNRTFRDNYLWTNKKRNNARWKKRHPWHVIYSSAFSVTVRKSCWKRVFIFPCLHSTTSDVFNPETQTKKKAGNHQSGRCVQISETFCSSLAALFSTSLIFSSILSPSIYYLTFSPQQKRAADNPRFPPFLLCQTILPLSFPPYFNVWHILSRSMVFIHSFILPNPPSSSLLLIFLSVCLSHFIRLTLHFPLPSIIVTPWLCLSIPNLWDWYIWTLILLKTRKAYFPPWL